jgi:hypothetical protein
MLAILLDVKSPKNIEILLSPIDHSQDESIFNENES